MYRLGNLFKSSNGDFDIQKNHINGQGEWVITAGLTNNGILGRTDVSAKIFKANTITVDMFGAAFYRQFQYKLVTHARVFSLSPNFEMNQQRGLFFANAMTYFRTQFGFDNMCSWEKIKDLYISLPQTDSREIDFTFIDSFMRELERARLRELEAYLKATGLDDYELTAADKTALNRLSSLKWKEYPITDIFTIRNTHNILASDIKLNSGTTPYLCASADNNSIGGYISYNTDLLEPGNCVFIGGKTFVVSYQKDDFFSNDSHNIALYLKNYTPTRSNLLSLVTCVKKSLGHKYTWGDSVSKAKIKRDTIMLPTSDGKNPDFAIMEQLIAAVQKIVIADVAKYATRNLEATQQIIERQVEQQKPTITPLYIHNTYQPGRIPLYTLRAACSYHMDGELPEKEGWVDASGNGFTPDPKRHFAIHAKGNSMQPKIQDGDICAFEWYRAGSREGEIVLNQIREHDPVFEGPYTIKKYHSVKKQYEDGSWEHEKIQLIPLNKDYDVIELDSENRYRTIGIFKCVL